MGYKTYKKIGNTRIEIEADSLKSLLMMSAQFPAVEKCSNCGSQEVYPSGKKYDGNSYYFLECQACGATLPLGQHKEGNSLFWKRDSKFEVYKPKEGEAKKESVKQSPPDEDNVPF